MQTDLEVPDQQAAIKEWRKLRVQQLIERLDFLLTVTPEDYLECLFSQLYDTFSSLYDKDEQLEIESKSKSFRERLEAYIDKISIDEI